MDCSHIRLYYEAQLPIGRIEGHDSLLHCWFSFGEEHETDYIQALVYLHCHGVSIWNGTKRKAISSFLLVGLQIQHVSNLVCGTVVEKTMPRSKMGRKAESSDGKSPWEKLTFAFMLKLTGLTRQYWPWMRLSMYDRQIPPKMYCSAICSMNRTEADGWFENREHREELSVHHKIWKRQRSVYVFTKC